MIRVGGATEVEVKERKDRVDDAMHATRAAVEEGILPGDGVPLLRAVDALNRLKSENEDQYGETLMACRSAPGFPELREQPLQGSRAWSCSAVALEPGAVQQSVRQYLIEGPQLFAVHRCPFA